jgi:outer membrane immunogenic protein
MTHRQLIAAATASAAMMALAAPALAQDQPAWTGWYIGGNLGGSWGDTSGATTVSAGTTLPSIPAVDVAAINSSGASSNNKSGFTGGIEGGYNWVNDGFLFGIESDWGWMDVGDSSHRTVNSGLLIFPPVTYTINQRVSTDWIWTLRPRIGFISDRWLFYGTGGIATTDIKLSADYADTRTPATTASVSSSETKTGWVAGLGGAYAFNPEWSVKGEWLYADFGHASGTAATPDGFAHIASEGSVKANLLRLGFDYRF